MLQQIWALLPLEAISHDEFLSLNLLDDFGWHGQMGGISSGDPVDAG
jgi:hypothetical protein